MIRQRIFASTLLVLSLASGTGAKAQIFMGPKASQQAQKAAKKDQKRAAKRQRKAMKQYRKAQKKAAKAAKKQQHRG